ncbi:DNA invertase Pin-like site-specific DNA recombinase [Kribbella steppae]|uniref:DNA invertase Pin-like site-specific DNA recombinase n=1 Tax=Kribbella steppae TaxID=2512223 RepID=A0A4R2HGL0_9ACTN|nr:recombinase family protein [Kribbella steppae]TCO28097.1 DNA invertase Pin-like site-specific DNA recombinase [Kribbella steppae]
MRPSVYQVTEPGPPLDDALTGAGCSRTFREKLSGKNAERPELWKCLEFARPNDTITVTELWRLGRNLQDLNSIIGDLRWREIGFRSLHEALDTTTPGGRLVFHVFAALGEFIREMIVQGTREGLDAARARGARLGRPPATTSEQVQHARDLLGNPDTTVSSIARLLGVSRATIYKYVSQNSAPRRCPAQPLHSSCPQPLAATVSRPVGHSGPAPPQSPSSTRFPSSWTSRRGLFWRS